MIFATFMTAPDQFYILNIIFTPDAGCWKFCPSLIKNRPGGKNRDGWDLSKSTFALFDRYWSFNFRIVFPHWFRVIFLPLFTKVMPGHFPLTLTTLIRNIWNENEFMEIGTSINSQIQKDLRQKMAWGKDRDLINNSWS